MTNMALKLWDKASRALMVFSTVGMFTNKIVTQFSTTTFWKTTLFTTFVTKMEQRWKGLFSAPLLEEWTNQNCPQCKPFKWLFQPLLKSSIMGASRLSVTKNKQSLWTAKPILKLCATSKLKLKPAWMLIPLSLILETVTSNKGASQATYSLFSSKALLTGKVLTSQSLLDTRELKAISFTDTKSVYKTPSSASQLRSHCSTAGPFF